MNTQANHPVEEMKTFCANQDDDATEWRGNSDKLQL